MNIISVAILKKLVNRINALHQLPLFFGQLDVYLNIVGGFRIDEPAGDLAAALALYSALMDKPVPEVLAGEAGFNLEFLPSQYWNKAYLVDGKPNRFPRYAVSDTKVRPNAEKVRQSDV